MSAWSRLPLQRSPEAEVRRLVKRFLLKYAYRDPKLAETVNRKTSRDILTELIGHGLVGEVPFDVVKGEVLVDSRGRGSFQQ